MSSPSAVVIARRRNPWGLAVSLVGLLGLLALFGLLAKGLSLNPRDLPSALVGKPAPTSMLQALAVLPPTQPGQPVASVGNLQGQVWVLNVWASWCAACRDEHPVLVEASRQSVVPIVGLAYKDKTDDSLAWLRRHGNPYAISYEDATGRLGIELGVYGVPETFVIDQAGVVRHRSSGAVTQQQWREVIAPLVARLKQSGGVLPDNKADANQTSKGVARGVGRATAS